MWGVEHLTAVTLKVSFLDVTPCCLADKVPTFQRNLADSPCGRCRCFWYPWNPANPSSCGIRTRCLSVTAEDLQPRCVCDLVTMQSRLLAVIKIYHSCSIKLEEPLLSCCAFPVKCRLLFSVTCLTEILRRNDNGQQFATEYSERFILMHFPDFIRQTGPGTASRVWVVTSLVRVNMISEPTGSECR
jgi:hypothetical protein